MLTAAAVCPHPPLLVPEVAGGAAHELDGVRAACATALRRVQATAPDLLVVVGGGPRTRTYGADAGGGLRGYGVDVRVGAGAPVLPLSLTIGRWLVERYGAGAAALEFQEIREDAPTADCLRLGNELAGRAPRVGLLVMGDGSARRGEKAPGYHDERAEPHDRAVAAALGRADAAALARLDPAVSRELLAAGRAAWQVLAGAAGEHTYAGELLGHDCPYGVGYFVACWTLAG